MKWIVLWTRPAIKDMQKLDRGIAKRIHQAVNQLAETGQGDVRSLSGKEREWRLRVGSWRARFTYDKQEYTIIVLRVLPRGGAYKN